jgi:DNA-binding HxlR family transcriptional regulator
VEYRLTAKGRDLQPVVDAVHSWAEKWVTLPEVKACMAQAEKEAVQ